MNTSIFYDLLEGNFFFKLLVLKQYFFSFSFFLYCVMFGLLKQKLKQNFKFLMRLLQIVGYFILRMSLIPKKNLQIHNKGYKKNVGEISRIMSSFQWILSENISYLLHHNFPSLRQAYLEKSLSLSIRDVNGNGNPKFYLNLNPNRVDLSNAKHIQFLIWILKMKIRRI